MTIHHETGSSLDEAAREAHRITDRDVYLLVALEVGVMLLWAFWDLVNIDLTVTTGAGSGSREVTLVSIVLTTTFATAASFLLLWLLRRRGMRAWTIAAATTLLVSCTGPLLATSPEAGIALLTFHVAVGAGLIMGVRYLHRAEG